MPNKQRRVKQPIVPTNYGIIITHKLEDEKELMLKVKDLLKVEIETGVFPE